MFRGRKLACSACGEPMDTVALPVQAGDGAEVEICSRCGAIFLEFFDGNPPRCPGPSSPGRARWSSPRTPRTGTRPAPRAAWPWPASVTWMRAPGSGAATPAWPCSPRKSSSRSSPPSARSTSPMIPLPSWTACARYSHEARQCYRRPTTTGTQGPCGLFLEPGTPERMRTCAEDWRRR